MPPFKTLEELAYQEEYMYGTLGATVWPVLFEFSTSPLYQHMWKQMNRFIAGGTDVLSPNQTAQFLRVKQGTNK